MNRRYISCRVAAFELGALVVRNYMEMNLTNNSAEDWADFFGFKPDRFHVRHMFIEGFKFGFFKPSPNELRTAARKALDDLHERLDAAGVGYIGQPPRLVAVKHSD